MAIKSNCKANVLNKQYKMGYIKVLTALDIRKT